MNVHNKKVKNLKTIWNNLDVTRFVNFNFWLPLLFVAVVAAAFRLPLLDSLPPGLNFDEGGEGVAALDVAQGHFKIWWPIGGGKEPLMAYLAQPLFWVFGPTRLALRLYSALMGVGAVLSTYFLASQLFPTAKKRDMLPLVAALGLATAFWHVAYSRIAFRALSNPTVAALAVAFLWRGLYTARWRDFLLAGFFTGGLFYTYLAGRFVPVAFVLFFAVEAALSWWTGRKSILALYWPYLAGMTGVAGLVFTPLGLFFLQNPAAFVERAGSVSIFSPAMNQGDLWGTLWRTTLTTLGTFVSLTGDPNPLGNIPGRPELGPLLAIFFVLAWGLLIWRLARFWRRFMRPEPPDFSPPAALFLLIWWLTMLLPAILAPEGAPHHLRLIGAAPATYILVGLGLSWAADWVSHLVKRLRPAFFYSGLIGWLLLVVILGLTTVQTYRDYFFRWANEIDHALDFDLYAVRLAEQMAAETDPTLAYIIPMDLRAGHEARHYSLDFLHRGQTPYTYIPVDETAVAPTLTRAAQGKITLKVVRWTADKHREADAKEIVTYLLETQAQLLGRESFPVYDVETYQLPVNQHFALPAIDRPSGVTFDNRLRIDKIFIQPTTSPGRWLPLALTFAPLAKMDADYKASLRLLNAAGQRVAQKDRVLLHNFHQGTSLWPPETVNEYYLLPIPADAPPGEYTVTVVIYHPITQAPLVTADGRAEAPLGAIQLK